MCVLRNGDRMIGSVNNVKNNVIRLNQMKTQYPVEDGQLRTVPGELQTQWKILRGNAETNMPGRNIS